MDPAIIKDDLRAAIKVRLSTPVDEYGEYAGFVSRMVAFLVDNGVIAIFAAIAAFVDQFIVQRFGLQGYMALFAAGITSLLCLLFAVAYSTLFLVVMGQTPGKYLMGVRVVRTDGGPIGFRMAFRRYVAYWLSLPLFWGFLLLLVDDRRRDFPDRLAHTYVLYAWPEPTLAAGAMPLRKGLARLQKPPQE